MVPLPPPPLLLAMPPTLQGLQLRTLSATQLAIIPRIPPQGISLLLTLLQPATTQLIHNPPLLLGLGTHPPSLSGSEFYKQFSPTCTQGIMNFIFNIKFNATAFTDIIIIIIPPSPPPQLSIISSQPSLKSVL